MERAYRENRETVLLLVIPIAIVAKLIEHLILPDKYFYDSNRMLMTSLEGMVEGSWGGNYEFTAELFAKINIFNFTTLLEWSLFLGIIFNIVLLIIISRIHGINFIQAVFTLMCIGLCNIYVFNLGKDIIQFTLFAICFFVISIDKFPNWIKVLGCSAVFYWESTFFRNYYIIMAAFVIGIYIVISFIRKKNIEIKLRQIVLLLLVLYLMMYVFLNIAKVYMPEEYQDILICKSGTEIMAASTMINDYIEFGLNINLYMLNYIINSMRMLFPIELLTGGIFYVPFLAFQLLVLLYLYKCIKNIHKINNKNVIALCVYIGFFMGSVLFEPDFGSFARHEAAALPIIILFALDNSGVWQINNKLEQENKKIVVYK